MKTVSLILALLVVAATVAGVYLKHRLGNPPDGKDLQAAIDAELAKLVDTDPTQGLVVGVYKDGTSFAKGYGRATRDGPAAPDATTVFQIASVSKLITASLLQMLCDEGRLDMDATLGELLGDSIVLSPAAQRVTLRQLATHTSGFPRIPKLIEAKATELAGGSDLMRDPYGRLEPRHVFEYLASTPDLREPGRFEYSNFGMGLLGHVLEHVTGQTLEALATEKLLAPLDMRSTAIALSPATRARLIQGYSAGPAATPAPPWTFSALAGAGAFHSTADDLLKFVRANIEDTPPLSRTLGKMHAVEPPGATGIGWMQPAFLDRMFGNASVVWHNGMVGGYAAYIAVDTRARIGIVVLSNKAVDVTMLGMMLARQARTQSWAGKGPSVRKPGLPE